MMICQKYKKGIFAMKNTKSSYPVSITEIRRRNYPNACRVIEQKGSGISDVVLGALESIIIQNGLQDKDYKYIEWAIEGLSLGVGIVGRRGDGNG